MQYGYIYVIIFLDPASHLYMHYYIGQRKYKENESLYDPDGKDYYHGSSVRAYKEYWPFYSKHKKVILEWCNNANELRDRENYYIEKHINKKKCINCCISNKINPSTYIDTDIKDRISNSLKQFYKEHPDALERLSNINKGKPSWNKGLIGIYSEEVIQKMSESHKGKKPWNIGKTGIYSEDTRKKISNALKGRESNRKGVHLTEDQNKGKQMSEEQKEKLRIAHTGKKLSEEHKKKIGDSQRGKHKPPLSDEHRKKLSEAHTGKKPWNTGKKGTTKWIYNEYESKMVDIEDLEYYFNLGYKKGRGRK